MPESFDIRYVIYAGLLVLAAGLLVGTIVLTTRGLKDREHRGVLGVLIKNSRRLTVLIAGTTVIVIGVIISPLPGPGLSILGPLGLAIIATEFVWARRLIKLVEQNTTGFRGVADSLARRTSKVLATTLGLAYWAIAIAGGIYTWQVFPPLIYWPLASVVFTPIFYWIVQVYRLSGKPEATPPTQPSPAPQPPTPPG
ncbi:MAG: hypothetical protein HRU70_00590 [Phycisphaeraceae bacterium]|nr:MAG: hypothetical protein HRU70_00590 [Phycisphaeraceae bacterium]